MKYLLLLLLLPLTVLANEVSIDPATGDSTLLIHCTLPTEREDNTPLTAAKISHISYWISINDGPFIDIKKNTPTCGQSFDLTNVVDGVYTYVARTVDTDGRESVNSSSVILTVKRQANPNAPTGVSGSVN